MNMENPQYSYSVGDAADKEIAPDKLNREKQAQDSKNEKSAELQKKFDSIQVGDYVTIKSPKNGELSEMKVVAKENGKLSVGPRSEISEQYAYSVGMTVDHMDEIIDSYTPKNPQ